MKTRKGRKTAGLRRAQVALQWGRVDEDAEGVERSASSTSCSPLQWGRVDEDAEGERSRPCASSCGRGFNGAASMKTRKVPRGTCPGSLGSRAGGARGRSGRGDGEVHVLAMQFS